MVVFRTIAAERYEASTEELQAANQKLLTMNDELRAPSEELETSREELQSLVVDRSELKRAEEARAFLAAIVESSEDSVISIDFEGTLTSWNRATERLYGYPAAEALGQPFTMLTLPEDVLELLRRAERNKQSQTVETFDTVRLHKDGHEMWLSITLSPVRNKAGRVIGISMIARDITARRLAEAALRENEAKYRSLFDSIDEGFCVIEMIFDAEGAPADYRFLEVNPAFEKQTGLDDATGMTMRELRPKHEAHWFEIYGKVAQTGEAVRFENRAKELDRWYDVFAFRLGGPESRRVAVVFSDVTERRRVEAELRTFKFLSDCALDGHTLIEGETMRLVYVNKSYCEGRGYTEAELLQMTTSELNPLYPTGKMSELIARARRGPVPPFEAVHQRKDGSSFPVEILTTYIDIGGKPHLFSQVRDITGRKRTEEALSEREEQFRRAIEDAPIPVIMHAEDGEVLQISGAWTELTGYTPDAIPTFDSWVNQADGFGADQVRHAVHRLFTGGSRMEQLEFEIVTRTGEHRRWDYSASTPGKLRDGRQFIVGMARDVTKRTRTEEALRESEQLYRTLFDLVPVAVYICDAEGRIEQYNRRAVELWGRAPETNGEKFCGSFKMFHPDGRPMPHAECPMARVLRGENLEPDDLEVVVEQRDGTRRHVIVNPQALTDEDGKIIGAINCGYDITDRKRAEEALWESQRRLHLAQEAGNVGIWDWNAATGQTYWTETTWKMYGYESPLAPVATDLWSAHLHPEDRERLLASVARLLASKENDFNEEFRIVRVDGAVRWIQSVAKVTRDAAEKPLRMAGVNLDITERKAAEEALAGSQERLRLVVENAREYAIFSLDPTRMVTSWNAGAERLLGWTEAEIIGQSADVIFTAEDCAQGAPEHEAALALGEGRAIDERWHVRKDGTRFWGSGVMMAMRDGSGQIVGLVKIFRDDTEAREAKQAIEQSRQELWEALQETERARAEAEAAGLAKDNFLAVLSHELRTPLTPVLMAVQTLARRKDLPGQVTEALEMIRRNVQLEAHFIDDLLDLTRVTRGKLELVREPMDLHEAVRRAVEISMGDIEGKLQRLTLSLEASQSRLEGDFMRLQQVFWNLLKNASKFTPDGGSIQVTSRNEPNRVLVEIIDNGVGFEPQDAERIFDAFAQANRAVTREFGGLGLGLAISKATVDAHGGTLRASSLGSGKGATFTIELPLG